MPSSTMNPNSSESSRAPSQPSASILAAIEAQKCRYCVLFKTPCADHLPVPLPTTSKATRPLKRGAQNSNLKCSRCLKRNLKCIYKGDSFGCTHCDSTKVKCVDQVRPAWRAKRRATAQDPKEKCRACFENRGKCDGVKPKCGRCVKWGFHCVPRGTKKVAPVKREDKCRRCRQTDRRCSHTLPCEWCVKNKLVCKPSLNEEKEAREVVERRERDERRAAGGGEEEGEEGDNEDDMSEQSDDEMVLARDEYEREDDAEIGEDAGQLHGDVHMEGDEYIKREESQDLLGNEEVDEEPIEPPPILLGIHKALIKERMRAKKFEQTIAIRGAK